MLLACMVACKTASDATDSVPPATSGADAGLLEAGAAQDASSASDAAVPDAGPDPDAVTMAANADTLLDTMLLRFWTQLRTADNNSYWTYAQDWDVVLDGIERRGPLAYAGTVRMFWDVQNARGWSRDYYDDENWMTLTLMRAYDLTGATEYLDRAKANFDDIMGAWDVTCCGPKKGGIWWRTAHDSKVTAINAGAVVSASRLYERTKDATYLAFAQKVYDYWSTTMVDAKTGHVYDGISSAGDINTAWSFTYNEGLMIGAAVALSHAEGGTARLPLAHQIAGYMLGKESASTSVGVILSDGKCGKPGGDDGEQFKGIGARYLAQLYATDPTRVEYKEFLRHSARAAFTLARDPGTGLVSCDWGGPYDANTNSVNSLSSAAMTLSATAQILGASRKRGTMPIVLQAEEGDLHGALGLEAAHTGFEGFGYVAGWGADGQWVDFLANVAQSGTYDAELRFATEPAGASRLVYVNGATVAANLALPTTGGYDTYGTVKVALPLAAGNNTISVIYNLGQGSHGFVNLDRLTLSAQ